jgi:hypothetical protein
MWNLLSARKKDCIRFLEQLEATADKAPGDVTPEELLAALPSGMREHAALCGNCRTAGDDLLATRSVLETLPSIARKENPWFAPRIMARIAEQERDLETGNPTWRAVPKLASRLAGIAAVFLLLASTWLVRRAPNPRPTPAQAAVEGLFETSPAPAGHEDVLISVLVRDK